MLKALLVLFVAAIVFFYLYGEYQNRKAEKEYFRKLKEDTRNGLR